jgi:predicted branched-subunit amino acid permease
MSSGPLLRNVLSLGVAVAVFAVSFGVLSVSCGFGVAQTCALSLLAFTGASQFLYVSVLGAGGAVASALAPALLLAGRNAVYAASLNGVLSRRSFLRALQSHLVIDESTAMAHAQPDPARKRRAFQLTGATVFVTWNAGTLAGALAGRGLGDPSRFGLDAMFPAVFLALLAPQLRTPEATCLAAAGGAVAVALLPLSPAGVPVLAAALVALPALLRPRRRGASR